MRWFSLVVAAVVATVLFGACGGETATEGAPQEPAKVEEEVAEGKKAEDKGQSLDESASVDCQLGKAEADLGAAGAEGLIAQWHAQEVEPRVKEDLSSALPEAKDLRTFLAERGYDC